MTKPTLRVVYERSGPPPADMRYSLDVYDARGNWVEQRGQLQDLDSARAALVSLCAMVDSERRRP